MEVSAGPSNSTKRSLIDVNDSQYEETIDEWLRLTDDLSDCDMDFDDEICLPKTQPRNASAEPAAETDLNSYEVSVLLEEDAHNDFARRQFVPTDSVLTESGIRSRFIKDFN